MSRVEAWLQVLETDHSSLEGQHPADGPLLSLLVHAAFADGHVQEEEFDLLLRLMPGVELGEVLVRISEEAQRPLDYSALLAAVPQEQDALLRLARRMVWADEQLDLQETEFLRTLMAHLAAH